MLNRYPLWKCVMLIVVIVVGLLYALPNLFGEECGRSNHWRARRRRQWQTLIQDPKTLQEEKITAKSVALERAQFLRASTH
ncbi:hypothetical protein ACNKHR_05515 [Shigella flexneri]